MNKDKIGNIATMVSNIIFVIWALFTFVGISNLDMVVYVTVVAILFVLFGASCIVANICHKDKNKKDRSYDDRNDIHEQ